MTARSSAAAAFTLVELLVVVGIIAVLMVLMVPAFTTIKGGSDVTSAAYQIAGVLEQARTHAIAHNTYVWVGFYEENANSVSATSATPPYPGKGRVLIGIVASRDGTEILDQGDPATPLPAAKLVSLGKLVRLENLHLVDIGAPTGGDETRLDGRPRSPYQGGFATQNRISSENTEQTKFPFTEQGYTFHKTIRFSPTGEARINSTYNYRNVAEIGLRPTHGTTVDTTTRNVAAVQLTGVSGAVKIYRR